MGFEKQEYESNEWFINIKEKEYPLTQPKAFLQTVMLSVLLYWAFLYGESMAYQFVDYSIYLSKPICNAVGLCQSYDLIIQNSVPTWIKLNTSDSYEFPTKNN